MSKIKKKKVRKKCDVKERKKEKRVWKITIKFLIFIVDLSLLPQPTKWYQSPVDFWRWQTQVVWFLLSLISKGRTMTTGVTWRKSMELWSIVEGGYKEPENEDELEQEKHWMRIERRIVRLSSKFIKQSRCRSMKELPKLRTLSKHGRSSKHHTKKKKK